MKKEVSFLGALLEPSNTHFGEFREKVELLVVDSRPIDNASNKEKCKRDLTEQTTLTLRQELFRTPHKNWRWF